MISIGHCELGKEPRIVAIVDEFIPITELKPAVEQAHLLEMRIDCYRRPVDEVVAYLNEVRNTIGLPMIGTVRENDYTAANRVGIFTAVLPFVDAVDLELGTPISAEVVARAGGKTIVVSEHDFSVTPDMDTLNSMVDRSLAQGAHIVKIATMANSRNDVIRLLEFTRSCSIPVVTMAMGPIGTVSRVIAPLFGSLYTFGYLTKPVAPGQLSVAELAKTVSTCFPD